MLSATGDLAERSVAPPLDLRQWVRYRQGTFLHGLGAGLGSFSIYEQPKWERIVASTQVGFRVSIWVRIRIRVWIRVRIRVRVRLGLYFGCSYIEKGPRIVSPSKVGITQRLNLAKSLFPFALEPYKLSSN